MKVVLSVSTVAVFASSFAEVMTNSRFAIELAALSIFTLILTYLLLRYAKAVERYREANAELARKNLELVERASRDVLTGLWNRSALIQRVESWLEKDEDFSLIFVDVDHFKKVNDTHGHATGDDVLRMVSSVLSSHVRNGDMVARYGGEEFCIVVGASEQYAALLAERLRVQVSRYRGRDIPVSVTASFGVCGSRHSRTVRGLLERADQALYESKGRGRNRVAVWSDDGDCEVRASAV